MLPKCPICHNLYSQTCIPYSMQPCSHSMCKSCADTYFIERQETSCPECRLTVIRHTPNYALKEVTDKHDGSSWRNTLLSALENDRGIVPEITDELLPVAPAILHRLSHEMLDHYSLVVMVRHLRREDVFEWNVWFGVAELVWCEECLYVGY